MAFVGTIFPNLLLYSSFPASWANSYAALISGSLMLMLGFAVVKFIKEFRAKHKADVYYLEGEPARYAKLAFNAIDWNNTLESEHRESGSRLTSLFQVWLSPSPFVPWM